MLEPVLRRTLELTLDEHDGVNDLRDNRGQCKLPSPTKITFFQNSQKRGSAPSNPPRIFLKFQAIEYQE